RGGGPWARVPFRGNRRARSRRRVTRAGLIFHSPVQGCGQIHEEAAHSAKFGRRLCSATWGRHPTGWGESVERAFPHPASGHLFVPGTDRRADVFHPL